MFVDAALGATVAVVVAVTIAVDLGGARNPDFVAYLFAVCLGGLMLVRRQLPVLTLVATAVGIVVYHAVDYPAIGVAIPVAAALYSAAEAGRLRTAVGIGALLALVSTGFRLGEGDDPAYLLGFELASTVGLMAAAIALGEAVRANRRLRVEQERAARRAIEDREREAARRVEEERLRVAREVHDVLAHTVAVISVQADVAAESLTDDPSAARAAVAAIRLASDDAVREIRSTVGLLREPREDASRAPTGSLSHLPALVEQAVNSGLPVHVRVEGEPVSLPSVVDTAAYRIVQESLTNCLRHAGATRADVTLRYDADRLGISVRDDGRGGNGSAGRGIQGMRERAVLLGGDVEASSQRSGGFRVQAWLPLEVRT